MSEERRNFNRHASHHCTVSSVVAFLPKKNHLDAIMGPANDATPWNPWLKFKRAAAYFGVPSTAMYEFAATSRQQRPHPTMQARIRVIASTSDWSHLPITNVHPTNPPYFRNTAEGQKKMAPGKDPGPCSRVSVARLGNAAVGNRHTYLASTM